MVSPEAPDAELAWGYGMLRMPSPADLGNPTHAKAPPVPAQPHQPTGSPRPRHHLSYFSIQGSSNHTILGFPMSLGKPYLKNISTREIYCGSIYKSWGTCHYFGSMKFGSTTE